MYKILVVDDDLAFLDVMAEVLELEGYEVVLAEDGRAALRLIKEQNPNLIIADIMMPGMSGLELLKLTNTCTLPFILLSGCTDRQASVEAQISGAYSFIYKPFDVVGLLSLIEECLLSV